jgi:glycerol-3-phosphate dehydrogenase subunit B
VSTVLVIGDGVAATAAAWRARAAGAQVIVAAAGAGASVLAGGALDDLPWESVLGAAHAVGAELRARPRDSGVTELAEALDLWRLPREGEPLPFLATTAGRIRPACGHDRALLDLASLSEGTVVVPRADRAGWDADGLAATWNDDPFARRRSLRFVPLDVALLRFAEEERIVDADLAARHDEAARLAWLAQRLREAFTKAGVTPRAVLLGPWLGLDAPRAAALAALVSVPSGEALTGAGSPAGLRFARARDRLFSRIGVTVVKGRVVKLFAPDEDQARPSIALENQDGRLHADRIVLACGGLVGGGIVYQPLDMRAGADMPEKNAPPFQLSFELDRPSAQGPFLASNGARIGVASSMFGADLDLSAWPAPGRPGALETVGVACDEAGLAAPYLAAAGDVVADRPRTMLVAIESGLRAGAWAAQ